MTDVPRGSKLHNFSLKVQSLKQEMRAKVLKVATQQIMSTRVEMMLEYHQGEWSTWDIAETVHIYNDSYLGDAFSFENPSGDDAEMKSSKDDTQNDE